MRHLLAERDLEDYLRVDSAGTSAYHIGARADGRMRQAAQARGYPLDSRSRQVSPEDFQRFTLILAMDRENRRALLDLAGDQGDRVRLLSAFLPAGAPEDVPDPYYGGPQGFETVLDMIEEACPAILDHLLAEA